METGEGIKNTKKTRMDYGEESWRGLTENYKDEASSVLFRRKLERMNRKLQRRSLEWTVQNKEDEN